MTPETLQKAKAVAGDIANLVHRLEGMTSDEIRDTLRHLEPDAHDGLDGVERLCVQHMLSFIRTFDLSRGNPERAWA